MFMSSQSFSSESQVLKAPIGIQMRHFEIVWMFFLFFFFKGFLYHPASVHMSCKYIVWPCGFTDMGVELLKIVRNAAGKA